MLVAFVIPNKFNEDRYTIHGQYKGKHFSAFVSKKTLDNEELKEAYVRELQFALKTTEEISFQPM